MRRLNGNNAEFFKHTAVLKYSRTRGFNLFIKSRRCFSAVDLGRSALKLISSPYTSTEMTDPAAGGSPMSSLPMRVSTVRWIKRRRGRAPKLDRSRDRQERPVRFPHTAGELHFSETAVQILH
jgi:hypothetical protein